MKLLLSAIAAAAFLPLLLTSSAGADWCVIDDEGTTECHHGAGTYLELHAGWNLIAGQGLSVDAVVRLCPSATVIQGWDAAAQAWEVWSPALTNPDFVEMEQHRGYWTYCDESLGWWASVSSH